MQRQTRAQRIASDIAGQIADGILRRGDKLPSLREYVRLHGYSKNTVITAYEYLAAEGLVEARHGRGFFVREAPQRPDDDTQTPPYARALDTIWMMRQQLVREPGHSHLGEGFPPVDWLMDMRLDKFHRQVVRGGVTTLFRYGNRFGNASLREQLTRKIASYGINALPQQILTTFGANHAMDLILRRFTRPGDAVLVENPGYYPYSASCSSTALACSPCPAKWTAPTWRHWNACCSANGPPCSSCSPWVTTPPAPTSANTKRAASWPWRNATT